MPDKVPIIIRRKKVVHGGHHGGAWKVAYADFITALMSLFIVLWLMNSSSSVKEAVAGYFQDPKGIGKLTGTDKAGKSGKAPSLESVLEVSKEDMPRLKQQLEETIKGLPDFQKIKQQIAITLTAEGLRIEMMETDAGMFFESGSSTPTAVGDELLRELAKQLGGIPNRILIEGHTDARPYAGAGPYDNWELSADRANQARRLMQAHGLRAGQVMQVRGFADQELSDPQHPFNPSNRRISVIVHYREAEAKKPGQNSSTVPGGTPVRPPKA